MNYSGKYHKTKQNITFPRLEKSDVFYLKSDYCVGDPGGGGGIFAGG